MPKKSTEHSWVKDVYGKHFAAIESEADSLQSLKEGVRSGPTFQDQEICRSTDVMVFDKMVPDKAAVSDIRYSVSYRDSEISEESRDVISHIEKIRNCMDICFKYQLKLLRPGQLQRIRTIDFSIKVKDSPKNVSSSQNCRRKHVVQEDARVSDDIGITFNIVVPDSHGLRNDGIGRDVFEGIDNVRASVVSELFNVFNHLSRESLKLVENMRLSVSLRMLRGEDLVFYMDVVPKILESHKRIGYQIQLVPKIQKTGIFRKSGEGLEGGGFEKETLEKREIEEDERIFVFAEKEYKTLDDNRNERIDQRIFSMMPYILGRLSGKMKSIEKFCPGNSLSFEIQPYDLSLSFRQDESEFIRRLEQCVARNFQELPCIYGQYHVDIRPKVLKRQLFKHGHAPKWKKSSRLFMEQKVIEFVLKRYK